jgi:uncharacterized protein (DUF2336 family)
MLKDLIARLFGTSPGAEPPAYERAQASLRAHALTARLTLAAETGVDAEVLEFLSGDDDDDVRLLVAANPSAPAAANARLARDHVETVRSELARKIARFVPQLTAAEHAALARSAIEIMEMLAADAAAAVRAILAEELKSCAWAPPHVIQKLARDLDDAVAGPVLEYSPLLSDDDLLEIVAGARAQNALTAIARRNYLSSPVAEAVVATYDVPAIQALLMNASARVPQDTLDRIAERAAEHVPWHRPIAMRPDLSVRAVRRLAEFVSANLLEVLERRSGLDPATKAFLRMRLRARLDADAAALGMVKDEAKAAARIHEAAAKGRLDQTFVMDLVEEGARAALIQALSIKSGIRPVIAEKILASRNGKAIAALVWKSGFNARLALKVQTLIAHVPGAQTVLPREGDAYPLTPDEMTWQLDFFGALGAHSEKCEAVFGQNARPIKGTKS